MQGVQPVVGVAVGLGAGRATAAHLHVRQVVLHIVHVVGGAEHGRGGAGEPVQAVVDHAPAAVAIDHPVGDDRDVAHRVVGIAVVVNGGRPVGIAAAQRQLPGILRQRVDDAVAVGEADDRAVGGRWRCGSLRELQSGNGGDCASLHLAYGAIPVFLCQPNTAASATTSASHTQKIPAVNITNSNLEISSENITKKPI